MTGKSPEKVVVAMSGGVDSSTTAAILKEQGYEVVGMTMVISNEIDNEALLNGVRSIAESLGIDHHVRDFRPQFKRDVIDYFVQSYQTGLTPNPCVICNRLIKFGSLLVEARALGARYLATGHYVRINHDGEQIKLFKGADPKKDQSYFLYRLQQEQLKNILFPLGAIEKSETRKLAAKYGLSVANKAESQDLCFLGRKDYREFLQTHSVMKSDQGPIKDLSGQVLGTHEGLWKYTVGQRRGMGISSSDAFYVVKLDVWNNTLIVGTDEERGQTEITASQVNFISGRFPTDSLQANIKIRYTAKEVPAEIIPQPEQTALIKLERSLPDITPGQSVVFYQGDELLGGGFIQ